MGIGSDIPLPIFAVSSCVVEARGFSRLALAKLLGRRVALVKLEIEARRRRRRISDPLALGLPRKLCILGIYPYKRFHAPESGISGAVSTMLHAYGRHDPGVLFIASIYPVGPGNLKYSESLDLGNTSSR